MSRGFVYLVGAGPGDPGLITVKGAECLKRADVVVYDYLANDALLDYAPNDAELIYAGKIAGHHNQHQSEINRILVEKAAEGKQVVRLKGGDPFVFGRGGEECEALSDAGIPFAVVPGVTSALGAAATAAIPLTHRSYTPSVTFVTGHEGEGKQRSSINWHALGSSTDTIVFYMGIKHLRSNMELLSTHGRNPETPVALVRWGTTPSQKVITGTIADIADRAESAGLKPPALTIVGDVVSLRGRLDWFGRYGLAGRRVMVTRAADQAGEFSRMLESRGALVTECPTIELFPVESEELDIAINNLAGYDWLILTSANAVRFFFRLMEGRGMDSRALAGCRVCAVGPKTAEAIESRGIRPDLIPESFDGEGVVKAFKAVGVKGARVLFPRADRAREVIPSGLSASGAVVDSPVLYINRVPDALPPAVLKSLEKQEIDIITFSASSTVTNLAALLEGQARLCSLLEGVVVASIGPVTTKTCVELGIRVDIEPGRATLADLLEAMEEFLASNREQVC